MISEADTRWDGNCPISHSLVIHPAHKYPISTSYVSGMFKYKDVRVDEMSNIHDPYILVGR